jgi:putative endonuclease
MAERTKKRVSAERRGHRGEMLAELALRLKGWRIMARRYKTHLGEIDLIVRRGTLVAMVEVKARPTLTEAMDAVTHSAQRRIMAAAAMWLSRQPDAASLSIRFDIMAVLPGRFLPLRWPVHVQGAFE